ncbi:MAG: hypothetical protein J7J92_03135 [Candidatus Aenigmarchaeota archaeon]|nr:hypothetical protein [Candidatus Aenigmarchaeota archaeon]
MGKRKKGQMFLISGILIILGLLMVKNLLGVYQSIEEKRAEESIILDENLQNILKEYEYCVGLSSLSSDINQTTYENLVNLTSYIQSDFDTEVFFVFVYYNKTAANYTLTIGNYLGEKINLTIDGGTEHNISDESYYSEKASATTDKNITIDYTFRSENRREKFLVTTSANLSKAFFDITIKGKNINLRRKDLYNRTW